MAFDQCKTRPSHVHAILNGLDRYNPETTAVFQEYVVEQCQEKTFDCYANLALLKLYQFNPHLLDTTTTLNILAKALTVFPSPAFSLSLALLPPYTSPYSSSSSPSSSNAHAAAAAADDEDDDEDAAAAHAEFIAAVQKLAALNTLLESAQYAGFWAAYRDPARGYARLTADVSGFEDLLRLRIFDQVGRAFRRVELPVLQAWLDLPDDAAVEKLVADHCAWSVERADGKVPVVRVPANKENEARGEVKSEKVELEQFGRVIRRGFEQPV